MRKNAGHNSPRASWRHRSGVAVALIAYIFAAFGFPLPAASVVRKDHSQPFPCQGHVCGCQSAEECWSSCCCYTPEERWAWADAHGVEPPAYAEKPAHHGDPAVAVCDADDGDLDDHASCCAEHSHKTHVC